MRRYQVEVGGRTHTVDVTETDPHRFSVVVEGQEFEVTLSSAEDVAEAIISPEIAATPSGNGGGPEPRPPELPSAAAFRPAAPHTLPPIRPASPRPLAPPPSDGDANGPLKSPMPGTITAVEVRPGDEVQAGQVLLKLEAMKMVNALKAPHAGIVSEVRVQPGESVGHGHVLVTFEGSR
jgi:biotin carboxyl carrier protein